jgi:hypothetical protein
MVLLAPIVEFRKAKLEKIIDLCTVSLLARKSFDFNRGLRRCSLEFTDLRFCLKFEIQLRCLSKINLRYLTSSDVGITLLLNVAGGKTGL